MRVVTIRNGSVSRVATFVQLLDAAFTLLVFGEVKLVLQGDGYEISDEI